MLVSYITEQIFAVQWSFDVQRVYIIDSVECWGNSQSSGEIVINLEKLKLNGSKGGKSE